MYFSKGLQESSFGHDRNYPLTSLGARQILLSTFPAGGRNSDISVLSKFYFLYHMVPHLPWQTAELIGKERPLLYVAKVMLAFLQDTSRESAS